MKRIWRLAGLTLTLVALAFFVHSAHRLLTSSQTQNLPPLTSSWPLVVAASVIHIGGVLLGGLAWHFQLRSQSENLAISSSLGVFMTSQFGKYLPGNVGHFVGRVAASKRIGLSGAKVSFTLVLEAAFGILAAVCLVLLPLGAVIHEAPGKPLGSGVPSGTELAVFALVATTTPWMSAVILNRWRPGPLRQLLGTEAIHFPSARYLIVLFAFYLTTAGVYGLTIWYLAQGYLTTIPVPSLVQVISLSALSWVSGFLIPGAPAGLGIRDALLVVGLTPLLGGDRNAAVALAILTRAANLLGDLGALALGLWLFRAIAGVRNTPKSDV